MTSKVFVGNLAFQTTDQALAEAFIDCGKVKSGVVITRGRRSLGYGFVEFETNEEAQRAVDQKNNSQLKGRQVKVELASDQPVRTRTANQNTQSDQQEIQSAAPRRGGRKNRPRRNNNRNNSQPKADNQDTNQNTQTAKRENNNPEGGAKPKTRKAKKIQSNDDKVLSSTAVFVANLPFAVKDTELEEFFKEHHPKTAHVVVTRNGRSRGYGFVEFESENDQKAAIASKNKQKFTNTDRELTVTASYKTQELTIPQNT